MKLKKIEIVICEECLEGHGDECHTAGCALWLHIVDIPIDPLLYDVIDEFDEYPTIAQDKPITDSAAEKETVK
jgi:hypothetical protein